MKLAPSISPKGGNAQRFQLGDFRTPNRPPLRLKIAPHFSEGGNAQRFQLGDFRTPNRPPLRLKIA
jgi:hypothetical protein